MIKNKQLIKATKKDAININNLYEKVKNQELCTWNSEYPTMVDIEIDLETDNLYLLKDQEKIIFAASVVSENELDEIDCFQNNNSKEIARVVVNPDYQHQQIAKEMLSDLFCILKNQGIESIHLAVAIKNTHAMKLYKALGFTFLIRHKMFGNEYYICEKIL